MCDRAARIVLAIDPGTDKCGAAVCSSGGTLDRAIVASDALPEVVRTWLERYAVTEIVVGNRTNSAVILAAIRGTASVPIRLVEESGTTLAARARYFAEHPPRGWRRLVPRSLQVPPEPYDDYAAILLAEAALRRDP